MGERGRGERGRVGGGGRGGGRKSDGGNSVRENNKYTQIWVFPQCLGFFVFVYRALDWWCFQRWGFSVEYLVQMYSLFASLTARYWVRVCVQLCVSVVEWVAGESDVR